MKEWPSKEDWVDPPPPAGHGEEEEGEGASNTCAAAAIFRVRGHILPSAFDLESVWRARLRTNRYAGANSE